jgi:hypothetical protein
MNQKERDIQRKRRIQKQAEETEHATRTCRYFELQERALIAGRRFTRGRVRPGSSTGSQSPRPEEPNASGRQDSPARPHPAPLRHTTIFDITPVAPGTFFFAFHPMVDDAM